MLVLVAYAAIAIVIEMSLAGDCGEDILSVKNSPDQKVAASIVRRNCGATTAYSYRFFVHRRGEVLDLEKGQPVLVFAGNTNFSSLWTSDRSVVLTLPDDAKVFQTNAVPFGILLILERHEDADSR